MSGTYKRQRIFKTTVSAAQESANAAVVNIYSGSAMPTDSFEFIGQVRRAGVEIPGFDMDYSTSTGLLTVSDAGSVSLTANDVITISGTFV